MLQTLNVMFPRINGEKPFRSAPKCEKHMQWCSQLMNDNSIHRQQICNRFSSTTSMNRCTPPIVQASCDSKSVLVWNLKKKKTGANRTNLFPRCYNHVAAVLPARVWTCEEDLPFRANHLPDAVTCFHEEHLPLIDIHATFKDSVSERHPGDANLNLSTVQSLSRGSRPL